MTQQVEGSGRRSPAPPTPDEPSAGGSPTVEPGTEPPRGPRHAAGRPAAPDRGLAGLGARPRLEFLDGVRALAALYVVAHHIWLTTYPDYPRDTGPAAVGWLIHGHLAVAVFIVVSGYSLTIAPARRGMELGGVGRFVRRRAWRILPPYWAALALSCIVFALVTPQVSGHLVSLRAIVVHGLLLQDVINSPKPNGAFWSIAIEWQIYFLFPLVLLGFRRLNRTWTTVLAVAGVVAAQIVGENVPPLDGLLNLCPQFFALFVFGSLAASLRPGRGAAGLLAVVGAILAAGFVLTAFVLGPEWIDARYFWIDLVMGAATAALLAAMAGGRLDRTCRVLASRPLVACGAFSYSMYLVHLPLLHLAYRFVVLPLGGGVELQFLLLIAIGIPVVLAGSYAFYRVAERPFVENRSLTALRASLRTSRRDRVRT